MPKARPDLAARMDAELAAPEPLAARPAPAATEQTGKGRWSASVPPSREGKKRIQGYFSARVKRQMRMLSAQTDKTEEQLVGEALNLLFQTNGLPAIAFEGKEGSA